MSISKLIKNRSLKILLIDDDEADRMALCRALKKSNLNAEVTEADNGQKGLTLLENSSFDCAFLDYRLPDMDGLQVLQILRQKEIKTPVIVATGYGNEPIAVELMKAGAADYLTKSLLNPDGISQIIRNVIRVFKAESTLQESEERYRDLFENANDLIQSINTEGKFEYVNRAWRETLGYSEEEIQNLSMLDVIHPGHRKQCQHIFQELMDHQKPREIEVNFITKEGKEIILEGSVNAKTSQGKTISTRGIFRDITERKQAEKALKESEARTQAILDNMLEGLVTIDQYGNIESMNRAMERIFGFSQEELLGTPFFKLFIISQEQQDFFSGQKPKTQKMISHATEWEGRRKNGELFPFELTMFEFYLSGERCFAGSIRDITERQEVDRLKKEFISTVSHELRTPLTSIRGSLRLMEQGFLGELPLEAQEAVEIAERNTTRLIFLINDILDLERLDSGKMEMHFDSIQLDQMARKSIDAVRDLAKSQKISITSTLSSTPAMADEGRLIQLLVNLLSNAIKFSPPESKIEVYEEKQENGIVIFVKDYGRGIPENRQKEIFKRFEQVESSDSRQKVVPARSRVQSFKVPSSRLEDVSTILKVQVPFGSSPSKPDSGFSGKNVPVKGAVAVVINSPEGASSSKMVLI